MTGGLGNQMFGYALLLKLNSLGIEVKVDDFSEYENHDNRRPLFLKDAFGIEYPKVSVDEYNEFTDSKPDLFSKIRRKIKGRQGRLFSETPFTFSPEVLKQDNSYLIGYFQSEKYFADIKEDIIKAFTFTKDVTRKANEILERYKVTKPEDTESVSIHIRRGDYVTTAEVFGNICTEEYYDTCIGKICEQLENPTFYVLTNDPEWAEGWVEKYGALKKHIFVIKDTTEETGYIDMNIMSRCKHNIMANSSFSWWGAYLNRNPEKIVYAPKKWVNTAEVEDIYCNFMRRV